MSQAEIRQRPLGRILVDMGALSPDQLEQILAVQRHKGGRLGEIVVERGLVSPLALVAALARQKQSARTEKVPRVDRPSSWKPLGLLLVEQHRISNIQLREALADQREDGGFLGEILVHRGWITPAELVQALSDQLMSTEGCDGRFHVRERSDGQVRVLHVASSFLAATDYVFEEVLFDHEPEQLDIVRGDGATSEVVWSFRRQQRREPTAADLLETLSRLASELSAAS